MNDHRVCPGPPVEKIAQRPPSYSLDAICGAMAAELYNQESLVCDHKLYSFGSI